MQFWHYAILYYVIINIIAFILFYVDKRKAEQSKRRIPERSLLFYSFLGGSIGSYLGMRIWHHKTRKPKFRIFVPVWLVLHIAMICFVTYQNNHLVVTEYAIQAGFDKRIIQISDLHNTSLWWNKDYIPDRVRELDPDMIMITGDICDSNRTDVGNALYTAGELAGIADTYYITGNHEYWLSEKEQQDLLTGLAERGVHILSNEYVMVGGTEPDFYLIGLEDRNLGDATLKELMQELNEQETLTLLLAHEPQYIQRYADAGVDYVLAGHAHGGQWILPGIGPFVAPDQGFRPEYTSGIIQKDSTTMIISRGIGNSAVPVRLFNYPEIVVADFKR
ncbi:MAG: DUF1294 domain-containing protein [Lachnospiraceae bacterium]|nr:DUF1294 domain-containing protein [Lachnospiraceae bacterium]